MHWKTVLNSEVVSFLRSISMYWIDIGTEVAVLNSQGVPISQVVLKTSFTISWWNCKDLNKPAYTTTAGKMPKLLRKNILGKIPLSDKSPIIASKETLITNIGNRAITNVDNKVPDTLSQTHNSLLFQMPPVSIYFLYTLLTSIHVRLPLWLSSICPAYPVFSTFSAMFHFRFSLSTDHEYRPVKIYLVYFRMFYSTS